MAKYGKWITGILGWTLFGPIGGIIGFALGSLADSGSVSSTDGTRVNAEKGSFMVSLLVLVSAVLKADGKILRSELDYVKTFFTRNFGPAATQEAMLLLRDILKQSIPLKDVCEQIKHNIDYSARLQMMHFLFGIANADNDLVNSEIAVLQEIAKHLGISQADYASIKAMFVEDSSSSYQVLEIQPTATDEEVKKAYRKMAVKFHPDKVAHLGEEVQQGANEKFRKVNEAYEKIKKERGLV